MSAAFLRQIARVLFIFSLVAPASAVSAQTGIGTLAPGSVGPSYGKYVAVAAVAVGVVASVAIYYAVREPRITGCVFQSGDGLAIHGAGTADPVYLLEGASGVSAGERVTVVGKKKKDGSHMTLIVSRVSQKPGSCTPTPTHAEAAPTTPDVIFAALAVKPEAR